MSQVSVKKLQSCTTREAARLLDVTPRTIQLWSESGILKAWKTPGGHRRFSLTDIEALQSPLNKSVQTGMDSRDLRLLVIDDELFFITLYQKMIKNWNLPIELKIANDGYEGLITIGAWQPDIVITDLQMPNLDGVHMLNTLSDMHVLNKTRVLVVSALSNQDIDERGGLPEDVQLLTKPIDFELLESIVKQQCDEFMKVNS